MGAQAGPRFAGALLSTRFGRRIFLMFCLAALLPAAAVFWMTYRASADNAAEVARANLHEHNKAYAIGVFQRLQTALAALATLQDDELPPEGAGTLSMFFEDIALAGDGSDLAARLPAALRGGDAALGVLAPVAPRDRHDVILLHRPAQDGEPLVAVLRDDYLWGVPDELGTSVRICAYVADRPLFCGGNTRPTGGSEPVETEWVLFLKPAFGDGEWRFVAQGHRRDPLARYAAIFVPLAVGVLLLAMLLSSMHIRRVLGPLEALLARIRAFGGGGASAASASPGGDEFDVLTHTFEDMGSRIGQQMDTLRTMSAVDRLILERVPLARVAHLVLERARDVAPGATLAVVVAASDPAHVAELHLLARGEATVEVVPLPGWPAEPDGATGNGDPVPVAALPPGPLRDRFQQAGDAFVAACVIGAHDARTRLLLGFPTLPLLSPELRTQLVDLAERVAVASAFQKHEALLVHQARHDLLTGLPNRLATFEALAAAVDEARRSGSRFAVAFLDLDRFKAINDGLGHALGDDILVQSGKRLRESLAPGDFVGRFGGDEFFLILRRASTPQLATAAMGRLEDAFGLPIVAGQREFVQKFSAGIAFHPDDGDEPAALVRNADVAMYRAKKAGGAGAAFFEQAMNEHAQRRLQMENDLRQAIAAGDIGVHYQPRVDSRSGRIVGVEALARWTHPQDGPVPPQVFVTLAEECGLVDALGGHVLETACRQLADWRRRGFDLPMVGVNISTHQLRSGRLADDVRDALARWEVPPAALELEVTETMLVQDSESGATQLQEIRGLGVKVAIDDFGTGYSSLAYLTRLPSDTLKIDRAFVVDLLDGDAAVEAVVRSIIAIARDLGKHTVAEGVETAEQVALLSAWGCHVIQGYVYAKPLPADAVSALLAAGGVLQPVA